MKLEYFDLLSPYAIHIETVGGIVSPKIKDIFNIGKNTYQYYLFLASMDLKTFFSVTNQMELFESMNYEDKEKLNVFDLIISDDSLKKGLLSAYNFFIEEDVIFDNDYNCFIVSKDDKIVGVISSKNYNIVGDIINQRNYVKFEQEEDWSKVKSQKALKILEKIKKAKASQRKKKQTDARMEIGNIISAVAAKSNSLNMNTIIELTVFQLWDCFTRMTSNNIYDIQSMSVATWGDKEKTFDYNSWFNLINTDN